ncbi:ribosomal protein S5 [Mycena leptocephala]|nr:ribosomal protein S5 [Mycena leptocephala]
MKGCNNGKELLAMRIAAHALEIIHPLSDQNLIQALVDAIVNTGPRENSSRIDVSPLRRTRESAFCNVKSTAECLADELINTAKGSSN